MTGNCLPIVAMASSNQKADPRALSVISLMFRHHLTGCSELSPVLLTVMREQVSLLQRRQHIQR